MRKILGSSLALAALSLVVLAFGQNAQTPPRTTDERLAALESALATLETRFGLESTRQPNLGGETGVALQARVNALERAVDRLTVDVQRVDRVADAAARDAMAAQQAARDAALRAR
jgi:proline dehydrogenase